MSNRTDTMQVRGTILHAHPQSFAEYAALSRLYLRRLQQLGKAFRHHSMLVESEYRSFDADFNGLEEAIAEACTIEGSQQDIINSDGSVGLSSSSLNRIGFTVWYSFQSSAEGSGGLPQDHLKLTLQGVSAGHEPAGGITLAMPSAALPSLEELQSILKVSAETWDLQVLCVRTSSFERALKQEGDLYAGQWLLYLPFPDLGTCLPPDIHWEPFHKGILIQTTPHLPDANDPADVAAGKRVREVLDEFGLVWQSTYAIHGWPPDAAESSYEQFITGAPPGRKYRVRCIDFDGYDAERNVLLYAKLFRPLRRQPKHWGLRGWDGPVINEARRQVRAANGTLVEWHIGIEESAERVRTLLADYTTITDTQLKVILTPLAAALRSDNSQPQSEPKP